MKIIRLGPICIDKSKDFRCGCDYKFLAADHINIISSDDSDKIICDKCVKKLKDKEEGQT